MIKRIRNILLILFIVMIFVLASIPLAMQTRPFKHWLAHFASETISNAVQGEVRIGRIDGNFFTRLHLSEVHLVMDQDTLVQLPLVKLNYRLWPLLQQRIRVDSLVFVQPNIYAYQRPDRSWVFEHLAPPPSTDTTQQDVQPSKANGGFPWTIRVKQFTLENASVRIDAFEPGIPASIDSLTIELSTLFRQDTLDVHLQHLQMFTQSPEFALHELRFHVQSGRQGISLQNLYVQTAQNRLQAQGFANPPQLDSASTRMQTAPIVLSEFAFILPAIRLQGQPEVDLDARLQKDHLNVTLSIVDAEHFIKLNGRVNHVSGLFDSSKAIPSYSLESSIRNVIVTQWTRSVSHDLRLNGNIQVTGSGITPETADAQARIRLFDSQFAGRSIEDIVLEAHYNRGDLRSSARLQSDMGNAQLRATIQDLLEHQQFDLDLTVTNMNLSPILKNDSLASDLNFHLNAQGQQFQWDRLQGAATLRASASRMYGFELDTLNTELAVARQAITVDTLILQSGVLDAWASGLVDVQGSSDVRLTLRAHDLMRLNRFVQADTLQADLDLKVHASGRPDSLHFDTNIQADSLLYNSNFVRRFRADATGTLVGNQLITQGNAQLDSILANNIAVEQLALRATYNPDTAHVDVRLDQGDIVQAELGASYLFGEPPTVLLSDIDIQVRDNTWQSQTDTMRITFDENRLRVSNFELARVNYDSIQPRILVNGILQRRGDQSFVIDFTDWDLSAVGELLAQDVQLQGRLTLRLAVNGTAAQPNINFITQLQDGGFREYRLNSLDGTIRYSQGQLEGDIAVVPTQDSLLLSARIPAAFSLRTLKFDLLKDEPIDAQVTANNFAIQDIVLPKTMLDELDGRLDLNIRVQNTLNDMQPSGQIRLTNGRLVHSDLGVQLNNLQMVTTLQTDRISLDTLRATRDEGHLTLSGFAALNQSIFSGIVDSLAVHLDAQEFFLSKKQEHEIQVNADARLHGPLDSLRMQGNIEIPRSSFYLPALTGNSTRGRSIAEEEPLLVQATSEPPAVDADTITVDTAVVLEVKKQAPEPLRNLRGELRITIPRNTWFKDENMRVEIRGDLEILKTSEAFEPFGSIHILRGQYEFLGRRFKLAEGDIYFQGGEQINPVLNVTAEYVFRDYDRDKRTLRLVATERALEPKLTFFLDDQEITEGEAASYILFGRSPDQLSSGQQSDTQGVTGAQIATNVLFGALASQLTKNIGSQLGLDYIEIKGRDQLSSATFIVGKYLTPDLFMSYEHSLGTLEEDRAPQVVTVEYQLAKYLFLQLISGDTKSTGADIIFKYDQ